ncbi:aldo/keto reductase family oxidoreductase [Staphylococcus sp. SS87]|nr:aldo/keto reductase family oxidoreductase [Staphylococcus singaporensis]MBE5675400.1 aldo/keto reductase family oxidoreductase [Staphylococcus singaporensis]MBE5679272.1 aldo/keto reductase family oxidoreductase [Staphylococcus singaporensis]
MEQIMVNHYVHFSRLVQGFWRTNEWKMTAQELNYFINELVERGITTMDHADIYGDYQCEKFFGNALKLSPDLRAKLQIVTKCGIVLPSAQFDFTNGHRYDLNSKHIIKSVEQSLSNLNVDYLDSLLIHRPSPLMDPEQVADALTKLVKEGKIRSFGVSNFNDAQYQLLNQYITKERLHISVNQLELSPYHIGNLQDGTMDSMYQHHVQIMAWSPFAGGKIFDNDNVKARRIMKVIKPIAEKYGVTEMAVMISWLVKLPHCVMPILGTRQLQRIDQAIDGLQISLDDQSWFDIYTAILGQDIP